MQLGAYPNRILPHFRGIQTMAIQTMAIVWVFPPFKDRKNQF